MLSSRQSPQAVAAAELLRRRRARASLIDYAKAIDVPGKPVGDDEDSWIFEPVETGLAAHHALLLETLQGVAEGTLRTAEGVTIRNVMVFMPPGSAKSTYGSVVFPTWFMGKVARSRLILASYASDIARKQGRRARQIVRSAKYTSIFGTQISTETSAADEWALLNESEFMAGGILSGITGNRAHGLLIDDPIAGRDEADSETIRKKTRAAYDDDLLTRLVPGAWVVLIQTRWHYDDLAGSILPLNWAGESGDILCRDGQVWRVICLPAVATSVHDALGRKPGDLLWPEWFTPEFFSRYQANVRTWSALYQQQPAPDTGDYFKKEWLHEVDQLPPLDTLAVYGGSDYAVTADGGDYTVHVIIGVDRDGRLWLLDLWRSQSSSDEWIEAFCDLVLKWHPIGWAEEAGQIKAGVGPFLTALQRERDAFVYREKFPTKGDKAVRAQSVRGRMAMNGLYMLRSAPFKAALVSELMSFPVGVHDDQVDALGLVGQLLDRMQQGKTPDEPDNTPQPQRGQVALPGLPNHHTGTRMRI